MTSVLPSDDPDTEDADGGGPFIQTLRFTYRQGLKLAGLSVVWVLLSIPLVTVGPVTLGAYRAIISLRETGQLELQAVRSAVHEYLFAATLFGLAPVAFCGIGALYIVAPPQPGLLSSILGVGALYGGIYLAVVLVPTFYGMARGAEPLAALRSGYVATAGDPRTAVRLVAVTATLFAVSAVLTIALVVIFPGFVITYHSYVAEDQLTDGGQS